MESFFNFPFLTNQVGKTTDKPHQLSNFGNPLQSLEDFTNRLASISLSPSPSNAKDQKKVSRTISSILRRIISLLDQVLLNGMKEENDLRITPGQDIAHYWNYISLHFHTPSVTFIKNYSNPEWNIYKRGLAWICISVLENSFEDSLKTIYNENFDMRYYTATSILIAKKNQFLKIVEKLSKFTPFEAESLDIYRSYQQYKPTFYLSSQESDLPEIPISKAKEENQLITPQEYIKNTKENISHSSNTMSKLSLIEKKENSTEGNLKTIDRLIHIMEDKSEEPPVTNENNPGDTNSGLLQLVEENENAYESYPKEGIYPIDFRIFPLRMGGILNRKKSEKEEESKKKVPRPFRISKHMDFHQCYRENYFTFSSSLRQKNSPVFAGKAPPLRIPFERNIKILKSSPGHQNKKYTPRDIVYVSNREVMMSNSLVFYLNYYYKKAEFFKFDTRIINGTAITIERQNYQCHICRKLFDTRWYVIMKKIYWCSYFNRYICEECNSFEYTCIPAFVIKYWDRSKFPISTKARILLDKWYSKPVIYITKNDKLLSLSSCVQKALIIKRKIHKIFDLMKCQAHDEFAIGILKEYNYFLLKENLFSFKDLCHIEELIVMLRGFEEKFERHLTECEQCNYKGGKCEMCMKDEILMAYDLENVFYCNFCKKMFHKKCCLIHQCILNRM